MSKKYDKIRAAINFWVDLIKPEMQKELDAMPDGRRKTEKIKEFENNIKNFRGNLGEFIDLNMPQWKFDFFQLTCVGTPLFHLRAAMENAKIDPSYLNGKLIDMEITNKNVIVYNRKANTKKVLYDDRRSERNQDRQK